MNSKEKEQYLKQAEYYFLANQYAHAKHVLEKVIRIDANNSKANELLAYVYENSDQFDISFELLSVACNQNDSSPEALYYLGSMQLKKGLFDKAIENFKKAILKGGEFYEALHDLATAQASTGDITSALNNYEKCFKFENESHELFYNIARIYDELKRYDEAIAHYDKALSLNPDHAEASSNKGVTLNDLRRYDEAIAHFDKALSLKPSHAETWSNKGISLNELRRYEDAIAHLDKALRLKAQIDWVFGVMINARMNICAWSDLAGSAEFIAKRVMASERVIQPFPLLALIDNPPLHQKASKIYIQDKYPSNAVLGPFLNRLKNKKIRIGYFSADFHNHATGHLIGELFELHDKSQFELVGFSFGPGKNDEVRQRLQNLFDYFIEVSKKSDIEIAQLSRSLNIDIAIDLKGFTKDSRTGIFSYRAAPVQVNYLGYPGTMGAEYIDYIVADKILIPLDAQSSYTEQVVYLPNSYQVNDRKRVISDRKFTRQELGLPEHEFVFCCFNNNYKIMPGTFTSWMRILKSVDGSVLWLFQDNSWAVDNLKKEAEKQGIAPNRLVFAERAPLSEHLARHRQADLFLDTLPYNAHTTASDALWTGLPVLTLMGESFASRVAASLLNAIGLPELITSSQEEYEALAIELALNPKKLADIKLSLANNRLTAPLFDTPLFTKNLEAAYIKMVARYQADIEPEHIFIN